MYTALSLLLVDSLITVKKTENRQGSLVVCSALCAFTTSASQ